MVWLRSWKVWKTVDTFLKPEGSQVLQLLLPLTASYLSIFCGACSKEHCGKRWIPVRFWKLQPHSLWVMLSVVYFPFIVFGSIFSEGGKDSAGKQSPSHILNIVWNNLRFNMQVQHGLPDLWWLSCETAYRLSSIRCPAAYDPFFSRASHHSAQLELNP